VTLRLAGVRKSYGAVTALAGVDLEVGEGELLAVVGPSGSGKSTLLRVVAGLEPLTEGRVLIGGRDVTTLSPHRRDVAMVFQDYALYPHMTVRGNLSFGPRLRRQATTDTRERVERLSGQLGLAGLLDRYPDQLSGGQQQRVALARAMLREPRVYLFDEPLASLDAQLRAAARAEIVELHRRLGTTTLHVTHDQAEAMTVGDRVAVLADGALQQVGPPQQLYDEPANSFVARFLGSPPMNLLPGGGVLGGAAGTLVGVRPEDLELDPAGPIEGEVVVVEALGSETVLAVAVADHRLAVRTGPRAPQRPGERVRLVVDPARRHVFDVTTGARR